MDAHAKDDLPGIVHRAVARVLRALFRALLRQGYSYTAFDELARRVYVEVAMSEFGIPGKKPSVSRASILSGLTRKEVQRLVELGEQTGAAEASGSPERYNRAGRVLAAWAREAEFLDAHGQPRVLALQDGPASFAELVRRHSGDMPVRAVLDELVHAGTARRTEDGRIEFVQAKFLGRTSAADKLDLLGSDVADLIETIDHNVAGGDADPRFQRKVMYRDMPAAVVEDFRKLSASRGMALLQQLDAWLAARTETGASDASAPKVRLGLGMYYFEERGPAAPPRSKGKT